LFNTSASRYMSGYLNNFSTLATATGNIRVAGSIKLPIQGVSTVRLRCLLPNRLTKISKLTQTLYSSKLYNTRLFS
ncbi:hypothetical protein P280DRAFT_406422, partial [Massarina eburnea CBS 473.64]